MAETIFALSSGSPPAAIAVIRISGPDSGSALAHLSGSLPEPRRAALRTLRDRQREVLDRALVLWLPGPATATGEDTAELHLHGGRAVIGAVEAELASLPKLRRATPGEFTRRAFANGRIDLAEAEGLADLLSAETELQRRSALAMAGGSLSRQLELWREALLTTCAQVEALLDFGDEDDVAVIPASVAEGAACLAREIAQWLSQPRAEALKDGFRVALAGPPNAGKSSLFNALVEDEAAITAPLAGTTRDVLMRSVAISGIPFTFLDTAGLREQCEDPVEAMGVARARAAAAEADLVLWLGEQDDCPRERAWWVRSKCDLDDLWEAEPDTLRVSARTGAGLSNLRSALVDTARVTLPQPGATALNVRQAKLLETAHEGLKRSAHEVDFLLIAEELRLVRQAFDTLIGRTETEDMLDALFGRFCIGK